ncbi:MAG: DNA polymerase III subunit beta [Candidatus Sungiibacteriota bacterium]|uniref:Beta sliding clamp n=1 Tax=Candidatus Sungiibacteriota bacterium TaxID=2750080 RepID=A0A7T5UQX7_9BACT|nr:MAG: DNA polymerase III subunit beta [Candidatus Sungbacteria bacterium]
MRFSCTKENLLYAVSTAERFAGKNVSLPILSNILLETDDNVLFATATNLEYAVKIKIPGKAEKKGKISVPAKVISSLIQSIKDDRVNLEEKQSSLLIKTDTKDTKINGVGTEDFPILPKIKKAVTLSVLTADFKRGLDVVLPSVSQSEFKPELTGVLFRISGNTLKLAATDTFRLAEKTLALQERYSGDACSFIVPYRVAQELVRLGEEDDEEAEIAFGDNQLVYSTGHTTVISRTIEGSFPEYGSIVPKSFETECYIPREEFIDAVKAGSIFSSRLQDITIAFSPKEAEITSANQEVGEYKTKIPVSGRGRQVKASFNYRFLLDGLSALEDDEIFFGCNTEQGPSLLQNKSGGSFFYVLMPIRTS